MIGCPVIPSTSGGRLPVFVIAIAIAEKIAERLGPNL